MLVRIPESHPRYRSLMEREKLVKGFKDGLVVEEGLLAHGRGEAFDYILGERTIDTARRATEVAAAALILAEHPVISMNGNSTALVAGEAVTLSKEVPAKIEVNLFYRSEERVGRLVKRLEDEGADGVLGLNPDRRIEGIEHARGMCTSEGIYSADWVLLSLEDGDRTEALRRWGKEIIAIDLNPLSRTAKAATITIVDNVTRAFPNLIREVRRLKGHEMEALEEMVFGWDNDLALSQAVEEIIAYLEGEVKRWREQQ